ncbi:MAG TPA: hypothetical protein VJJ22_02700 [Candidatus Paceibacterota bacterium]
MDIWLATAAALLGASIIPITITGFADGPLGGEHTVALATTEETRKRKIMLNFSLARPLLDLQYLLHGFKQCGRDNGFKCAIKPFLAVLHEAEIRTVG